MKIIDRLLIKFYELKCRINTRLRQNLKQIDILTHISESSDTGEIDFTGAIRPQKILLIIPFKDKWDLTEKCISSLKEQNLENLELTVVLVDNNSEEDRTKKAVARVVQEGGSGIEFRSLPLPVPFNFSRINNLAAQECLDETFDKILFLNNDIELRETSSIRDLVAALDSNQNLGALGSSLYYPDGSIQHLFVFPGSKIVGSHPLRTKSLSKDHPWFRKARVVPAVTGALIMMRRSDWIAVGGFDENLPNCYQDVDLCLKVQKLGKVNGVLTHLNTIHYETQTRKPIPHWDEVKYIYAKWGDFLAWNPMMPKTISRYSEVLCFDSKYRKYPWWKLF